MSRDEKKSVNEDKGAASNRRKRRAERNRLRTIKHAHKLLDQIAENIGQEFNHQGWCTAATDLNSKLSKLLEPEEYHAIGEAWRMLYTETTSNAQLLNTITKIKKRVAGNLYGSLAIDSYDEDSDD